MKKYLLIIFQSVLVVFAQAQTLGLGPSPVPNAKQLKNVDHFIDSLRPLLVRAKDDTAKIHLLLVLANAYHNSNKKIDSSFWYNQQAMELSQKEKYLRGLFDARHRLANFFTQVGNYPKALELSLANLPVAEQYKDTLRLFFTIRQLSGIYWDMKDFTRQLRYARNLQQLALSGYFKKGNKFQTLASDAETFNQMSLLHTANAFSGLNLIDSGMYYYKRYYEVALSRKDDESLALATVNLADLALKLGKGNDAQSYYARAISYARAANRLDIIADSYLGWAKIFQQKNQTDSALHYAKLSLGRYQQRNQPANELEAALVLDELYRKRNQMDSAHHYLALAVSLKDSLFNQEKVKQVQNLQFTETLREQQIVQERKEERLRYETNLKLYTLIGGLIILVLIALALYGDNRQKQKSNLRLQQQKIQTEQTLQKLKAAQSQLIQSEKMASLGSLTAGIAHEIQNPLNFVTNFSEVNKERIAELKDEIDKENFGEVKVIASDIEENEEKISFHGKRADAIVKNMLQHSRASTGQKEPTDINALADEYLRLSYHGFRAKDKSFNATIQTHFDESLGKINVVPQDIGRVLLNLFNNAFDAVNEKKKQLNGTFESVVSVTTKRSRDKVEICVKDNGPGIPGKVVDKIFQPFFTTKPTGQGTGLGLSLSYDIIKAHGGEIKVETKEGEGAEFIIILPI